MAGLQKGARRLLTLESTQECGAADSPWSSPWSNTVTTRLACLRRCPRHFAPGIATRPAPAAPALARAVSLPEARSMEPRQLQQAVVMTMAELRKGRVRRLLDWGRSLYRLGAVGYGAFTMFTNPWVAKAVLAALWSCLRLMGRLVL